MPLSDVWLLWLCGCKDSYALSFLVENCAENIWELSGGGWEWEREKWHVHPPHTIFFLYQILHKFFCLLLPAMWKKQKNIFHFFAEKKRIRKEEYRRYTRTATACVVVRTWAVSCVVYGERDQFLVEEKLRKISHFFSGHNSYILPIFFFNARRCVIFFPILV